MVRNRWGIERFAIDDRSLLVFRIGLGVLSVVSLLHDWPHLGTLVGPEGPFTDAVAREWRLSPLFPLYFWVSGSALHFLYAFHVLVAAAFTAGFSLRVVTPLLWFLTVSWQCRAEIWLAGFDGYLRLLLFWAMFLPLAKARWREPRARVTPATAAILGQVAILYVMSGLLKRGPEWYWPGSAISTVLSLEPLARPFGQWLRQFPGLLQIASVTVPWLECVAGCLLLSRRPALSRTALIALAGLHVGIGLSFFTGFFPALCLTALVLFRRTANVQPEVEKNRVQFVALAALGLVAVWNVASLGRNVDLHEDWRQPIYWLRLDQYWHTFSPSPAKESIWLTVVGHTAQGTRPWLDRRNRLMEEGAKVIPESLLGTDHWIEYTYRLAQPASGPQRDELGAWLCRKALAPLTSVQLMLKVHDETTSEDRDRAWLHNCASN